MALTKMVNGVSVICAADEEAHIYSQWKLDKDKHEKDMVANSYKYNRKNEMPAIENQLDALWHAMDEGILPRVSNFYEVIKSVKDKYPKHLGESQ